MFGFVFLNINQVFSLQLELSRSSLKVLLAANLKFLTFSWKLWVFEAWTSVSPWKFKSLLLFDFFDISDPIFIPWIKKKKRLEVNLVPFCGVLYFFGWWLGTENVTSGECCSLTFVRECNAFLHLVCSLNLVDNFQFDRRVKILGIFRSVFVLFLKPPSPAPHHVER